VTEQAHRPIPCADAVRRLWEYLDRELSPDDAAAVDEHLSFCRRCCGELEFAVELRAFLRSHAEDDLPQQVRHRLERFLEELQG
jgi:anti-sigma factor (TIGR02949 family)